MFSAAVALIEQFPAAVKVITPEVASTEQFVPPAFTTEYVIAPVPDDVAASVGVYGVSLTISDVFGDHVTV